MVLDHTLPGCSSSPEIGKLLAALIRAQSQYKPVRKSASFSDEYTYSTWTDIVESLYGPLLANGIVFVPRHSISPTGWVMVGTLFHAESGEWISSTAPIRDVVDSIGVRSDSQSFEIACTYAKKTLLMNLAGGWSERDESEQSPPARETDEERSRLDAQRDKAIAALENFKTNPTKLEQVFNKMEKAVVEGTMRESDCDSLIKKYTPKELANAQ